MVWESHLKADPPLLTMVPEWLHEDDAAITETRIFTLRSRRGVSPTRPQQPGEFVYIDCADWVNVVALTAADEVVVIEQFRHGSAEVTLEIPGGMVDPGEEPLAAGVRELAEETGYVGRGAHLIGKVNPNPAIFNNLCHTVLLRDAVAAHAPTPDLHEEIGVRLLPLAQIPELIDAGVIHHAMVVAAFHFLALQGGK